MNKIKFQEEYIADFTRRGYMFPWEIEGGGFWSKVMRDVYLRAFYAGAMAQEEFSYTGLHRPS